MLSNKEGDRIFKFKNPEHVQQPMIASVVDYFLGKGEPLLRRGGTACYASIGKTQWPLATSSTITVQIV